MSERLTNRDHQETASGWIVQCDFDGTISLDDVTDSLLRRFGQPGWQALEEAWERNDIGSGECMKGQIALLDMSEPELMRHLDSIDIDPGFVAFVGAAGREGIEVQVVSDGLDRAIAHVLRRHGLGHLPVFANALAQTGERRWNLRTPQASAGCVRASGNCKCARAALEQALGRKVLYVGDGSSDFCVSGRVDHVLAKSRLIDHCRARGIAHQPFRDFGQALALMQTLVRGEKVAS